MAMVFAREKFHGYVYGQPVKIMTDHKPLELLAKILIKCSPGLGKCFLNFRDIPSTFHPHVFVTHVLKSLGAWLLIWLSLTYSSYSPCTCLYHSLLIQFACHLITLIVAIHNLSILTKTILCLIVCESLLCCL